MMEQPEALPGTSVAVVSLKLALSDEARASIEAVRVAQEVARRRARRETAQARFWVAALLGAGVLGAFAFGPRTARWWHARSKAASAAQPASISPEPTAPAASRPAAGETVVANALGASTPGPESPDRSANEVSPVAAPAKAREALVPPVPNEGCDLGLIRSAPWRLSPDACARLFEADPGNATLALAIAQAEHAHGSLDEGARWAKRALALDPTAAAAYVLIARADTANGRPEDARKAYRHYLELAPRGWHHAEARGGVRRARTPAPSGAVRDR